ncbi:ribbon-helix-helix protein, CopG family [Methylocella sp. CPCC 101449]|uniref:ribbon-helix-helix protein, CopG family n=1 Tax=Methylocella sp. CPCC 101449 TaxID=2987531 RepID=UPI00390888E0
MRLDETLQIRCDGELLRALQAKAAEEREPISVLVRRAARTYLRTDSACDRRRGRSQRKETISQ